MVFTLTHPLILGSSSPRRQEILRLLDLPFLQRNPEFDEASVSPQSFAPEDYTLTLAREKALSVKASAEEIVLGVDTVVVFQRKIFGKPQSPQHAFEILSLLNGNQHEVTSSLSLVQNGKVIFEGSENTKVYLKRWEPEVLFKYTQGPECLDKAGAYAIQGQGSFLVQEIRGCYFNVMGLPIQLTLSAVKPFLKI